MMSQARSPLSSQERQQIRALARFLLFVLIAIALAAVAISVIVSLVNGQPDAIVATSTP
ncbi:MAG: hypothetical protein IPM16_02755 [Chloroflexi bacterium]|nr:hypothetical protein [Chloroflexota bacterium]